MSEAEDLVERPKQRVFPKFAMKPVAVIECPQCQGVAHIEDHGPVQTLMKGGAVEGMCNGCNAHLEIRQSAVHTLGKPRGP